jgi:hypothetical protein
MIKAVSHTSIVVSGGIGLRTGHVFFEQASNPPAGAHAKRNKA